MPKKSKKSNSCNKDSDCNNGDCCGGKCYGPDAEDRPKCYQEADFEFGKEEEYEEVTRKDKKTVMRIKGKGTLKTQDGMSAMNQTTINRLKGNKLSEAGRQVNFTNTRPPPQIYKSSGSNKTKKSKKKGSHYQDLKF